MRRRSEQYQLHCRMTTSTDYPLSWKIPASDYPSKDIPPEQDQALDDNNKLSAIAHVSNQTILQHVHNTETIPCQYRQFVSL